MEKGLLEESVVVGALILHRNDLEHTGARQTNAADRLRMEQPHTPLGSRPSCSYQRDQPRLL